MVSNDRMNGALGAVCFEKGAALLGLLLFAATGTALAQTAPLHYEYDKKIEAAQTIGPLGADMFGDSTSAATGQTEFRSVDIDIPGNNGLQVSLGRRLVIDERYLPEELGGIGNWDVDVPYIEGTFSKSAGWTVGPSSSATRNNRCSIATTPYIPGGMFTANEVWHGYNVYVPGKIREQMLKDSTGYADPTDGAVYPWTLKSLGKLSCLQTLKNGYAGQGFVLRLTDGTKYFFDYPVERTVRSLSKGPRLPGYDIQRKRVFLLATRVEDRFGNFVTYQYTSGKLTNVSSNDGRAIQITHGTNAITASAGGKTWTYSLTNGHLATVTNPAGEKWHYSPFGSLLPYSRPYSNHDIVQLDFFDPGSMCQTEAEMRLAPTPFSVTHPSGAQATYNFVGNRFYRSGVPYRCVIDFFDHNVRVSGGSVNFGSQITGIDWNAVVRLMAPLGGGVSLQNAIAASYTYSDVYGLVESSVEVSGQARIEIPNYFDVYSLQTRTVTGTGLTNDVTTYAYPSESYFYCGMYDSLTGLPIGEACGTATCPPGWCTDATGRWTEVTDASGTVVRRRFGVIYGQNEGVLLEEQVRSDTGAIVSATTYSYVQDAQVGTQAFGADAGIALTTDPMTSRVRPLLKRQIAQDGVTFTHQVETCGSSYCFDGLARPYKTRSYSSLGTSRIESVTFEDNLSKWVLGLPRYNWINAVLSAETVYNAQALPTTIKSFGLTQQTISWNADGTPASLADGNGATTTLLSWYRGVPRIIGFADGTTVMAMVDYFGQPTSVTNQLGNVTSFTYDPVGRITGITHPTGDTVAWAGTSIQFTKLTAAELGLAAGHWKQTVQTGNARKVTYFDARWRPQLKREYDASNVAATDRYQGWDYNAAGHVAFASYPSSTNALEKGIWTEYDALGRNTSVLQDSEHGDLVTLTEYLDQFRTRVTNPRGNSTTTSFLVYDQPDTSSPVLIQSPEGLTTNIYRTPLGQPSILRRSGTSGGVASDLSQFYIYDQHQRVCKAITFEGGATHFEYDAAGNVVRTADGDYTHTDDTCSADNFALSQKTVRTYDALNRLTAIAYPDGLSNATYEYYADGSLKRLADGDTTWWYEYNKRGLPTREILVASAGTYEYRWTYNSLAHLASRQSLTGNGDPVIDFAPNALGQPTRAGTYATNATYHPNGALKGFTYGNGIQRTVTLNDRQLPAQVRDALGTTARYDDSFGYDVNGNPTSITDALGQPGGTRTMAYDALDRLTYANIVGSGVATWTYDVLDNIRTHATTPTSGPAWSRVYGYDVSNRLTTITQNGAPWGNYTYDPRGNMIEKTGQTLVFDRASRLTQIPNVASYEYDGHGRRTSQWRADGTVRVSLYTLDGRLQGEADNRAVGSTDYMYLGSTLVAKRFQHWSGSPPVVTYQHSDGLGSPVLETDANGAVVSRERFLSYGGAVDGAVNDTIGYTGHQEDPASGLVYMQQRYYDPAIGRFLLIDPLTTDSNTGASFNRYWYADNSPYRFVDPDGRQSHSRDIPPPTGWGPYIDWLITPPDARVSQGQMITDQLRFEASQPHSAKDILLYSAIAMSAGTAGIRGGIVARGRVAVAGTELAVRPTTPQIIARTPGGRLLTKHAVERMISPPRGRVPMIPSFIDEFLNGATNIRKRTEHELGPTLTIRNKKFPGTEVVVDEATGNRVITVINPKLRK